MSISEVTVDDVSRLKQIAYISITDSVDADESDKPNIISIIFKNISEWSEREDCVFLKSCENGQPVGYILIKNYWNFSDIFLLPESQGKGIGQRLVSKALDICKAQSIGEPIVVNSSKNAIEFYRSIGFSEINLDETLPYNMVRFEYDLQK